jgi:hypothetical protein
VPEAGQAAAKFLAKMGSDFEEQRGLAKPVEAL